MCFLGFRFHTCTAEVDKDNGAALDLYDEKTLKKADKKKAEANAEEVHKLIDIRKVPMDVTRFGTVPLDPVAAADAGTTLIGCDVGTNGDKLDDLKALGAEIYQRDGLPTLLSTMDYTSAKIVHRVLDVAFAEGIIKEWKSRYYRPQARAYFGIFTRQVCRHSIC